MYQVQTVVVLFLGDRIESKIELDKGRIRSETFQFFERAYVVVIPSNNESIKTSSTHLFQRRTQHCILQVQFLQTFEMLDAFETDQRVA